MPERADKQEREADELRTKFGETLRRLRLGAGMTLEQLAASSNVSRAMLSSVELGEKSPTLSVLVGIASGLDVTVSQLMGDESQPAMVSVIRKGQRLKFRDPETGAERHLLSPTHLDKGIELVEHVLPKGQVLDGVPHVKARTDKYVIVIEGGLNIEVNDVVYSLEAGDSMYFEVHGRYRFMNRGQKRCRYYLFIHHQY